VTIQNNHRQILSSKCNRHVTKYGGTPMGRTRQYATATERQAAYRQRMKATTIWVERAPFHRMEDAIQALHRAMGRACAEGNPTAKTLTGSTPVDTLEATVAWVLHWLQLQEDGEIKMSTL
jgi:hypothetical protein